MEYPRISMGSRGETDTPGPGESVSAVRFIGKFDFVRKKWEKQNFENFEHFVFSLCFIVLPFKGL